MLETLFGRPLTFGDTEQIAHINALQAKERNKEERERKLAAGELVKFEVTMRVEGTYVAYVESSSVAKARELAREDLDLFDLEIDDIYIEECRAL